MTTLADKIAPYAAAFRRDGFVMVPDLLEARELERYGAAVDEAVARRKRFDHRQLGEKSPYEQSFIQCINLWEDTPAVRPLTFHPVVCETAARLLGVDTLRLWHDQALYKEAGGRLTDPHQDQPYWPMDEIEDLMAYWQRYGLQRHGGYLDPSAVARAVVTVVTAPPGVHIEAVEVQPEAPAREAGPPQIIERPPAD